MTGLEAAGQAGAKAGSRSSADKVLAAHRLKALIVRPLAFVGSSLALLDDGVDRGDRRRQIGDSDYALEAKLGF